MKNKFFILVVALMTLPTLQAQEFFKMGAKAGLNFSTLTGDAEDAEMLTSFHLGLIAEFPLSEKFSFASEVLYSIQGASFNDDGLEGDGEFKLDYIQIPLMAKYYVTDGFSLEAGPQIGFLTSSKLETEDEEVDTEDLFSSFDYGLNFGLGYKLPGGIFFQGRYNLGLANILDSDEFGDDKSQNSVIQISIGYMF